MGNAQDIFRDRYRELMERIGRQLLILVSNVKHAISYDRALPVNPADLVI